MAELKKVRLAILISGRGSNMQSLVEACKSPDYPAEPVLVLSNKASAQGLEFAKEQGIDTEVISHKDYATREEFDQKLNVILEEYNIEVVALAGFMRLLTPVFTKKWEGKALNIHPSLLPAFKGLDTHRRAIETKVKYAGCTIHLVSEVMDEGEILDQAIVKVKPEDTEETLASKVLHEEHVLYPRVLKSYIFQINKKRS